MKFHLSTGAGNVFTGYGDDYVRLGIVVYRENVVVTPERILTGWCPAGFDALTDADFAAVAELQPEIVLLDHEFPADLFWRALAINVLYMFAGVNLYLLAIGYARRHGMLMQMGE